MSKTEKKKKPVKAPATTVSVPQSRDAVAAAILEIGAAQRNRSRIQAEMNDHITQVKAHYEALAEPHNAVIQSLRTGVQIWCEANRDSLTNAGKVKFATFASGEVKWRLTPPSVAIKSIATVIDALKQRALQRFIRTKEDINKEAILADPDAVEGIAGITIGQREEFVIEPYETKLEEVV